MAEIVIGVDGGTTAVKAVAFNLSGDVVSTRRESVSVTYGDHGEAEQDMNQIWEAVATCIRSVADVLDPADDVVAIGLTGQGDGAWLVDEKGTPVRPAAIWLDGRASQRAEQWNDDGRAVRVFEVTGTKIFGGLFPLLIEELLETDPQNTRRAATHLNCKDWIRFKLTGERLTDYTEASRSYLDAATAEGFSFPPGQGFRADGTARSPPRDTSLRGDRWLSHRGGFPKGGTPSRDSCRYRNARHRGDGGGTGGGS